LQLSDSWCRVWSKRNESGGWGWLAWHSLGGIIK